MLLGVCPDRGRRTEAATGRRRTEDTTGSHRLVHSPCTAVHNPAGRPPGRFSRDLHGPFARSPEGPLGVLRPLLCSRRPASPGSPLIRSPPTSQQGGGCSAPPCPTPNFHTP